MVGFILSMARYGLFLVFSVIKVHYGNETVSFFYIIHFWCSLFMIMFTGLNNIVFLVELFNLRGWIDYITFMVELFYLSCCIDYKSAFTVELFYLKG